MKNLNKIIVVIFTGFFFLILGLTIQVWYNNYQINKGIENANREINIITRLIINDSLALSDSGKLVILSKIKGQGIKIDTTGITKRIREVNDVNQKLEATKRYVLDANTITYLIQIISFFLIGLQIFIGNKNEKGAAKIEKKMKLLSKKINDDFLNLRNTFKNNDFINGITYCSELVFNFSTMLNMTDNEEKQVRICSLVSRNLLSIQDNIKNNKNGIFTISISAKKYSLGLLNEVKEIFIFKNYETETGYFNDIYIRLIETIKLVNGIKEDEID